MASHVPLISLLSSNNPVKGLVDQPLCLHQVGVPGSLCDQHATRKTCQAKDGTQNEFASCHRGIPPAAKVTDRGRTLATKIYEQQVRLASDCAIIPPRAPKAVLSLRAIRTMEGALWPKPRSARIPPVAVFQATDQSTAAPTARASVLAPRLFAGAAIPTAPAA
jgi:hypothetical protein